MPADPSPSTGIQPAMSRHGLANLGNSCYLNSAIQALAHTTAFRNYFGTTAWESNRHPDRKGEQLVVATADLVRQLQEPGTKPLMPVGFTRAFITFAHEINEDIRPGAQADAAEAIQILLDGLHTHLARMVRMDISGKPRRTDQVDMLKSLESWATYFQKEYSQLIQDFYGQTQTRVVCDRCGSSSTRYEPWSVLKVPIPGAEQPGAPIPSLKECLAAAMETDTIDDYACDGCKNKGSAKMYHAISRFPPTLILSIKRFTNSGKKIVARVQYDAENIDLSEWRAWRSLQPLSTTKYRVASVVDHLGSMGGGHYVMRGRNPEGWFLFDDWNVAHIGATAADAVVPIATAATVATPDAAPVPIATPVAMPQGKPIGGDASPNTYILCLERI